jgi:HSP20 family molecular chaperone IbpA
MPLTEPFRELASLQNEMSRFMNGLFDGNGSTTQSWVPTADVWETEDAVVYAFDLPGIPAKPVQAKPQKISISVGGSGSEPKTIEGTATQK